MTNYGAMQLTQLLQRIYAAQARDVAQRLTLDGDLPDMTAWIAATANAVKPLLLQMTQAGMLRAQRRIADKLRGSVAEMRRHEIPHDVAFKRFGGVVTKAGSVIQANFSLFNPRVYDAVDAAAFAFCRETNETATRELSQALVDLRKLLKRGLGRGDAIAILARKVREVFADPRRAFTIAITETSRAVNGGEFIAAKESGVATHKEWVASSDACPLCLSIADKGEIPMDEPFYVDPRGGPYAVCMFPPVHPHDFCTWNPVI